MKRQVRRGVFETNSSSTHSLTMCSKQQFEDWKNGKLLYDSWKDKFIEVNVFTEQDKEDAKNDYEYKKSAFWKNWEQLTDEEIENWYNRYAREHKLASNSDYETYEEWRYSDLEYFVSTYTTPGGEEVVAFGKYGYDG